MMPPAIPENDQPAEPDHPAPLAVRCRDELSCGCAVEIDVHGTMHILPCEVEQHAVALSAAARSIAHELGIPVYGE